ncbi:MAG: hypothetical protein HQL42_15525 [Alphaproteobacteria bacterium]|nr:hypothetical protein [Alphaproteobacteria bacterium]
MSTIADGECFASKIPQAQSMPEEREEIEMLAAERDQAIARAEAAEAALKEMSDLFNTMTGQRDHWMKIAEAAEAEVTRCKAEVTRCKAEYARLRGLWLDQVDTIAIHRPVVEAAVSWVSEDDRLGVFYPPAAAVYGTVHALQAAKAKRGDEDSPGTEGLSHVTMCGDTHHSGIDGMGPNGPVLHEAPYAPIERAFAEAAAMLDGAHQPKSEKSCATCRHMDGEMCELSGAMAESCLDNNFLNWRPTDELKAMVNSSLQSLGIIERNGGVDDVRPNSPGLDPQPDKVDPLEKLLEQGEEMMWINIARRSGFKLPVKPFEKSCGTCDSGHGGECTLLSAAEDACLNSGRLAMWEPRKQFEAVKTCASCQFDVVDALTEEPCVSCQWPTLGNWQPKENNRDA